MEVEGIDKKLKFFVGFVIVVVILFCSVLLLKIPVVSQAMDGAGFCGTCHAMDPEVASYMESSHVNEATCGDCHVPHTVVSGSYYKAYTGAKDVLYTIAGQTTDIEISETGKRVLQNNCIQCHTAELEQIGNTMLQDGRYCFECHTSVRHEK